jgi:iron complex outermembrane receptor protein
VHYKQYMTGITLSYTGYRYINNSNTDWLDSFMLLNAVAGKSFRFNHTSLYLSGRINNILNNSYQNMENRPMPGRNYQISLRIEFAKQK